MSNYPEYCSWRGMFPIAGSAHLLALLAVVALPFEHWYTPAVLILVLGVSLSVSGYWAFYCNRWRLGFDDQGTWVLTVNGQQQLRVNCRFEFISPALVVIKARFRTETGCRRLVLVPRTCSAYGWRQLHILAGSASSGSGMADNDILGSKIDWNKDGVSGNI